MTDGSLIGHLAPSTHLSDNGVNQAQSCRLAATTAARNGNVASA